MKQYLFSAVLLGLLTLTGCGDQAAPEQEAGFNFNVEQFADVKVLRYQIPGFEDLTLNEQKLVYYMTQAGLEGRDIMWAQNYRHNLDIRKALEKIYVDFPGVRISDEWLAFETYLKRVWFSNGIHHHYSNDKMMPDFSAKYLKELLIESGATLEGEAFEVIFNDKDNKKVNLSKDADIVLESAINFYGPDVTTQDCRRFLWGGKCRCRAPFRNWFKHEIGQARTGFWSNKFIAVVDSMARQ